MCLGLSNEVSTLQTLFKCSQPTNQGIAFVALSSGLFNEIKLIDRYQFLAYFYYAPTVSIMPPFD